MHDAGGERQPLFPAAGERTGQLPAPRGQPQRLQCRIHKVLSRLQLIEPRHEHQVLFNRQVGVEREFLRHIADFAFDLTALRGKVIAEHRAAAGIGVQQAAHHADRRGLARSIRSEKADNLAGPHRHGHIIDHALAAIGFDQAMHVDDVCHGAAALMPASTIWPGRKAPAPPVSRASTRNTSFWRFSSE